MILSDLGAGSSRYEKIGHAGDAEVWSQLVRGRRFLLVYQSEAESWHGPAHAARQEVFAALGRPRDCRAQKTFFTFPPPPAQCEDGVRRRQLRRAAKAGHHPDVGSGFGNTAAYREPSAFDPLRPGDERAAMVAYRRAGHDRRSGAGNLAVPTATPRCRDIGTLAAAAPPRPHRRRPAGRLFCLMDFRRWTMVEIPPPLPRHRRGGP